MRILLKGDELAFQYLGRDEEKVPAQTAGAQVTPRNKAKAEAKKKLVKTKAK